MGNFLFSSCSDLLRAFWLGVKSLLLHPLRSGLTMLGVLIGVWSVIVLTSISQGASDQVQKQIESLGADTIIVRSVKPLSEKRGRGATPYGLTRSDLKLVLSAVPTLKGVLPIREIRCQFTVADRMVDGRLVGCTPEYANANRLFVRGTRSKKQPLRGRFLTDLDNIRGDMVCVLAAEVADRLFPYEDPIGKRLYIAEHQDYYSIVGVLEPRHPSAAIGGSLSAQNFSNDVYIPIKTLRQRIGDTTFMRRSGQMEWETVELNQLTLRVAGVQKVRSTAAMVRGLLDPRHEKLNDIAVVVPLELLEQARNLRLMFLGMGILIASISLLVGGIGIMNIMLASVTERTREIGIRRALGAKRRDITQQFLVETVVLSIGGATLGILFGFLGPPMYQGMLALLKEWSPKNFEALPEVIREAKPTIVYATLPLAVGIAVFVGLVSGLYPAIRAARMNPIDALRHE